MPAFQAFRQFFYCRAGMRNKAGGRRTRGEMEGITCLAGAARGMDGARRAMEPLRSCRPQRSEDGERERRAERR